MRAARRSSVGGVDQDDIHVAIEGNQVTIAADVVHETEQKENEALLTERDDGSVYRGFTLPTEIDEEDGEATYENGVLALALAKKPAIAGCTLSIMEAPSARVSPDHAESGRDDALARAVARRITAAAAPCTPPRCCRGSSSMGMMRPRTGARPRMARSGIRTCPT